MASGAFAAFERTHELRILKAIPAALSTLSQAELARHFAVMSERRRAICFTLTLPPYAEKRADVRTGKPAAPPSPRGATTVLVCFHVAPELAVGGPDPALDALADIAGSAAAPLRYASAPLRGTGPGPIGYYREAVYAGRGDMHVSVIVHAPAEIPVEADAVVAQATKGRPVDCVATIAVTLKPADETAYSDVHVMHLARSRA